MIPKRHRQTDRQTDDMQSHNRAMRSIAQSVDVVVSAHPTRSSFPMNQINDYKNYMDVVAMFCDFSTCQLLVLVVIYIIHVKKLPF